MDETLAINTGLDRATPGSLVVILPETVSGALRLIEARNPIPDNHSLPSVAPALPVPDSVPSSVSNAV